MESKTKSTCYSTIKPDPTDPFFTQPVDVDEIRYQDEQNTLHAHLRERYTSKGWNWIISPSQSYTRSIFYTVEIKDIVLSDHRLLILWK